MKRAELVSLLKSVIKINGHTLGVAVGNGMVADYTMKGGADFILAMNAGRFRQMGQSAFAAFFGYSDANSMVIDFATKEILPMAGDFPVIHGIFMQDPSVHILDRLKESRDYGFSGVINYPTIGCFDGKFRQALENAGLGFEKEVEGIRLAHFLDMFTLAYAFDKDQAVQMALAGADCICLHLGITGGGLVGANRYMSLEYAMNLASEIFDAIDAINPNVIKVVCSGPIQTPVDAHAFFKHTKCQGILVGSGIERLPVERAVINTTKAFKSPGDFDEKNIISNVLNGIQKHPDYAQFMLEYVQKNYQKAIRLKDISAITHMSISRLSVLFKEKTGTSFTQYLIDFRMEKACELLSSTDKQMKEISALTGYDDYSQFVKMFRKVIGMTPQEYRKNPVPFSRLKEGVSYNEK